MKRLLPFLLGVGFIFAYTNVNSKARGIYHLNDKQWYASVTGYYGSDLLLGESIDPGKSSDTSKPGNKNKSTTAQDCNSTRSNKANCVIVINVGNGSDGNDSTPQKHYAQDFNTVRSNRQNSAIIINIGNNNPNGNDSTPQKHYAQDFNTVRSNRQNSAIVINVGNNNTNNNDGVEPLDDWESPVMVVVNTSNSSSTSIKVSVKNSDTSRSTKSKVTVLRDPPTDSYNPWDMDDVEGTVLNPLYEGTNENGFSEKIYQIADNATLVIREITTTKNANQEKDNPLYGGENTAHENPLYNGNAIKGNNGNDSTNNPGKQPSRQEAQDYNSTRSNKCNCFSIDGGFANDNSNHAGNGWNIEMENQFSISKRLKLALSAGYTSLQFKYKGSPHLSEEYVQNMKRSIQDHKWSLMTFSAGPVLQLGKRKLKIDLYGKAGITFIQSPDQFVGIPGDDGKVTNETGAAKFSGSTSAFSFQAGVNLNYAISNRIDIFLNPGFFMTAGKNISYKEKDASKALINGKTFDYKTFMSLTYETKYERPNMFGVNAGLRIRFCR